MSLRVFLTDYKTVLRRKTEEEWDGSKSTTVVFVCLFVCFSQGARGRCMRKKKKK